MRTISPAITLSLLSLTMALPVGHAGSSAHPDPHYYYGISSLAVGTDLGVGAGETGIDFGLRGACYDLDPNLKLFPEPTYVGGDGDPETGIGTVCLPFRTTHGDDSGTTQWIAAMSTLGGDDPTFTVCVDVDGNGRCQPGGADEFNLCRSEGSTDLGRSLLRDGPCSIWLDPSAADPTVYIHIVRLVEADGGVTESGTATVTGIVWYA